MLTIHLAVLDFHKIGDASEQESLDLAQSQLDQSNADQASHEQQQQQSS